MRRLLIPITACAIALISVGGSPAGATAGAAGCEIHRLSTPTDAAASEVTAGDATGRWLAGTAETPRGDMVVRWHRGSWSAVDVPVENPSVTGINHRGDLVGYAPRPAGGRVQAAAGGLGTYGGLTADPR